MKANIMFGSHYNCLILATLLLVQSSTCGVSALIENQVENNQDKLNDRNAAILSSVSSMGTRYLSLPGIKFRVLTTYSTKNSATGNVWSNQGTEVVNGVADSPFLRKFYLEYSPDIVMAGNIAEGRVVRFWNLYAFDGSVMKQLSYRDNGSGGKGKLDDARVLDPSYEHFQNKIDFLRVSLGFDRIPVSYDNGIFYSNILDRSDINEINGKLLPDSGRLLTGSGKPLSDAVMLEAAKLRGGTAMSISEIQGFGWTITDELYRIMRRNEVIETIRRKVIDGKMIAENTWMPSRLVLENIKESKGVIIGGYRTETVFETLEVHDISKEMFDLEFPAGVSVSDRRLNITALPGFPCLWEDNW